MIRRGEVKQRKEANNDSEIERPSTTGEEERNQVLKIVGEQRLIKLRGLQDPKEISNDEVFRPVR